MVVAVATVELFGEGDVVVGSVGVESENEPEGPGQENPRWVDHDQPAHGGAGERGGGEWVLVAGGQRDEDRGAGQHAAGEVGVAEVAEDHRGGDDSGGQPGGDPGLV